MLIELRCTHGLALRLGAIEPETAAERLGMTRDTMGWLTVRSTSNQPAFWRWEVSVVSELAARSSQ